ncbi:MAG: hypothetical protein K6G81_12335 [Lachnospiraceae bacterium]|nr:hypothetical protein [Lachnospiraceae bacterium]
MTKMARQLQLYDLISSIPDIDDPSNGIIVGPAEIMRSFRMSLRMLQRDLKDLRDCGLINAKYVKKKNRYFKVKDKEMPEDIPARRMQHLLRLYRIGTLINDLSRTPSSLIENYESAMISFNEFIEMAEEDPENFTAEDIEIEREFLPDPPPVYDLKTEYYTLFPDSNERTRQRDFKELRDAGFELYYSKEYGAYIFVEDDVYDY